MTVRLVLLLGFLAALSAPASAEDFSLRLNNQSGKGVSGLVLTPKGTEEGADIDALAGNVLQAEQILEIPIAGAKGQCVFDLKVTFADSTEIVRSDMDLCQTAELIIE